VKRRSGVRAQLDEVTAELGRTQLRLKEVEALNEAVQKDQAALVASLRQEVVLWKRLYEELRTKVEASGIV